MRALDCHSLYYLATLVSLIFTICAKPHKRKNTICTKLGEARLLDCYNVGATLPMDLKVKVFQLRVFLLPSTHGQIEHKKHTEKEEPRIKRNNYNCVLCQANTDETASHLFFGCTFSKHCWQLLGIHWNTHLNFFDMLVSAKMYFPNSFFQTPSILKHSYWSMANLEA